MSKDEETVTIKLSKPTFWQGTTFVFALLFVISIWTGGFGIRDGSGGGTAGGGSVAPPPSAAAPSPQAPPPTQQAAQIKVDADDPALGDADAPVTIVEFSDFQCSYCGKFYSQTEEQLIKNYVETGKVRFIYKDFPLDTKHPEATPAAMAAECADEQDKFWEYHDLLFENQRSLSNSNYKQWAQQLGLDTEKFNQCLDSGAMAQEVADDLNAGRAVGVTGTPTFFINGQRIVGAQPFSAIQAVIEQQLA